eukprot:TRINITY_DN9656_c0_g1_i2.p1 TRINITY_DN9656_c0_g1~~TRINITY_DN9656_c0_g1_i2.p1  ORF type:complete len:278 (-),score=69.03 TRINITY_DN9656_c0_g1_i2:130-963(-)
MYVTRVINPEREVKKKQMAKELEAILQSQITAKIQRKEEERRKRILEEQQEETRWLREQEMENQKARAQNIEADSQPEPQPVSKPAQPDSLKVLERPLYSKHDMQLTQIKNQIMEKQKEFESELEKLKTVTNATSSTGKMIEDQLAQLRTAILTKTTTLSKSSERHYTPNIGKYGKLHFTKHWATSAVLNSRDHLQKPHEDPGEEKYLPGESQMLPWSESEEPLSGKAKGRTMKGYVREGRDKFIGVSLTEGNEQRTEYKGLDDLLNEFLINKRNET